MGEKIEFYPIDLIYKVRDGKAWVHIFGRMSDGNQVCVIDKNFDPYFYVMLKEDDDLDIFSSKISKVEVDDEGKKASVVRTEQVEKNFLGKKKKMVKVFVNMPPAVPLIKDVIKEWDMIQSINEYDIPFVRRYLIDKGITPLTLVEAEGKFVNEKLKVKAFEADSIKQSGDDVLASPKVLAFDIETYNPTKNIDMENNPILMISFYGEGLSKVVTWKKFKDAEKYVEFVDGESDLIEKFKEIIDRYRPDVITGYFSDGFDFPYIMERAKKYDIDLDIGLDYSGASKKRSRTPLVTVNGNIHLDAFRFIKKNFGRSLKTDSYKLEDVGQELLGEGKQDVDVAGLADVWDNNPSKLNEFCSYNLQDAILTHKLFMKLWPNVVEFVKIISITPFDATQMSFSQLVESYIFKQAQGFNEVAPNRPHYNEEMNRRTKKYEGAFVYEPTPGLYHDLVVFDFRSLYPTIITSHNIGLSTLITGKEKDTIDCFLTPDKKYGFLKKPKGFLPSILGDLISRRARVKEILKKNKDIMLEARSQSLKLLANSFYGYLGFSGARWYCLECATAVTAFGRHYINQTIDVAKKEGFGVAYGDSIPYDRMIFVRFDGTDIRLIKIGELYDLYRDYKLIETLSFIRGKTVFKKISKVIRHRNKDGLLKIRTQNGTTEVTPQHSVYSYDGKNLVLVDAAKLKVGDNLVSLTNPSFESKYKEGHIFDIVDLDMGKYSSELFLYSDNLMFPAKKGICPYCKKERILSTHVNKTHKERRSNLNKKSKFSFVGGKNAKTRKIPRYWMLDKDLAWLLGFYCAEGSVTDIIADSGRKCLLSFGGQDRKSIEKVKAILDVKTGVSSKIIENRDKKTNKNMFYYRVQCMPIVALFQQGFSAGKGSEFKKVPWFIFNSEESLRKEFIDGYLQGEGNRKKDKRYVTKFTQFSTKSKELAAGISFLLKSLKHGKNFFGKDIKHIYWKYRQDKLKIQSLRLQSAKECYNNFCLAKIKSIENIPKEKYVYDLQVEGSHNFADAEGLLLVHNTDSVFIILNDKKLNEAQSFVDEINEKLPGMMELEFEGYYPSGIFVSTRGSTSGAKKRYALIDNEGKMTVKGFETVRRNYSVIGKEVQSKVLKIVLKENDFEKAVKYVKDVVKKVREKEIENSKMIIQTQLTKDISEYASIGPHVAAAKKLVHLGETVVPGMIIDYIVAPGKGALRDRVLLPQEASQGDYDPDYYIENQIVPAVERILEAAGYTKDDLISNHDQSKLQKFFG